MEIFTNFGNFIKICRKFGNYIEILDFFQRNFGNFTGMLEFSKQIFKIKQKLYRNFGN